MQILFRIIWSLSWRLVLSLLGFYTCAFSGEFVLLHIMRRSYRTPTPWKISIALCFFTFCLLAIVLATASQFRPYIRPRRWLAGACILYTGVTLFFFGAFFGQFERPYRLLYILACGLSGLVAPWALELAITWRTRSRTSNWVDQAAG